MLIFLTIVINVLKNKKGRVTKQYHFRHGGQMLIFATASDELVPLVILGTMGLTIVAFFSFFNKRKQAFVRPLLVCLPVSCCIVITLFVSQLFFEYPNSQIEWEDRIDSFIRVLLLALFVGAFVSILWTLLVPSEKR